jgi:thioredoxin-like negative regulator of GroEL
MYSSLSSYSGFSHEVEHYKELVVIPDLTDQTIHSIYKKPSVLLCYAPWCSHCVQFKPVFLKLATQCQSLPVSFYQLDATDWPLSANQFDIKGYPSVFFIHHHKIVEYKGARSIPLLQKWIESMLQK